MSKHLEAIRIDWIFEIPSTYALMLQYIALRNRHQNSFAQFQQLISLLQDWLKFYDPMIPIVSGYPTNKLLLLFSSEF